MLEAARFGEICREKIRESVSNANPESLRGKIFVDFKCGRAFYCRGWGLFRPRLKIIVTIRDWGAGDTGMKQLIRDLYVQDLFTVKPTFLQTHLKFKLVELKKSKKN